jgi:sporulation protein YlmC with PRC-barrel domain
LDYPLRYIECSLFGFVNETRGNPVWEGTMKTLTSVCSIVALLAAYPALAQDNKMPTDKPVASTTTAAGTMDPTVGKMTANQLMGKDIYGRDGEDMAEIENIVRKGKEVYAVVDVDHVMDMSDKDAVVPLSKFRMNGDKLTLDMTKDELDGLEKWQKGKYEDVKSADSLAELSR